MLKEDFIKLGFTEEQAIKASEASQNELKTFVSKTNFDEVSTIKSKLEEDIKQRDRQIEDIKKSTGVAEELQTKITELQAENKTKDTEYQTQIKDLKINSAIKSAVAGSTHDSDLVTSLFDKSKLILNDDGKVGGIDEQLKIFQKDKPFLFKTGEQKNIYTPKDGEASKPSLAESIAEQLNNESTDNPYATAWGQK